MKTIEDVIRFLKNLPIEIPPPYWHELSKGIEVLESELAIKKERLVDALNLVSKVAHLEDKLNNELKKREEFKKYLLMLWEKDPIYDLTHIIKKFEEVFGK